MFKTKSNPALVRKALTFHEPSSVMFKLLITELTKMGYLRDRQVLATNEVTLMKLDNQQTALATISAYEENKQLEFSINKAQIGTQQIAFSLATSKWVTYLEVATQVTWTEGIEKKLNLKVETRKLKNTFRDWIKTLDTKLRDEMDRQHLKSYF